MTFPWKKHGDGSGGVDRVSVEKPAAWARRLTITVPADRIAREKKDAVQRLAKRVKLPGFRQGRVPAAVMEKKFGPAIEQEAIEKVIGDAYREALESEGLQPITQGIDRQHRVRAGHDLTFNVDLEVRPEVELERIGGFTVMREQPAVGTSRWTRCSSGCARRTRCGAEGGRDAGGGRHGHGGDHAARRRDGAEPSKPRRTRS
jgi:FKBP-type peptidyl-prolyl cis-trans isomerase (trigger factor)